MAKSEEYILAVGPQTEDRLKLLGELYNPLSLSFLEYLNLTHPITNVLDVGCGVGIMSMPLADRYAHVTAIDYSEEQIEVAKKLAANYDNIDFKALPAQQLDQLSSKFDLIYTRFVLCHISDAANIMQKMVGLLKPGGYLLCEESADYNGIFSYPNDHAHHLKFRRLSTEYVTQSFDAEFGKKVPNLCQKLGLTLVDQRISQPVATSAQQKRFERYNLQELASSLIAKGAITKAEIAEIDHHLKDFEQGDYIVGTLNMLQTCAQKPVC